MTTEKTVEDLKTLIDLQLRGIDAETLGMVARIRKLILEDGHGSVDIKAGTALTVAALLEELVMLKHGTQETAEHG